MYKAYSEDNRLSKKISFLENIAKNIKFILKFGPRYFNLSK